MSEGIEALEFEIRSLQGLVTAYDNDAAKYKARCEELEKQVSGIALVNAKLMGENAQLTIELEKLNQSLEVACKIQKNDKVGFDFAVLENITELQAANEQLTRELRTVYKTLADNEAYLMELSARALHWIPISEKWMPDEPGVYIGWSDVGFIPFRVSDFTISIDPRIKQWAKLNAPEAL